MESTKLSNMEKHWVEELFPPYYTYSTEEIIAKYEKETPPMDKVKALYEQVRQEINAERKSHQQKAVQAGDTLAEFYANEEAKLRQLEESCIWTHKELEIIRELFEMSKAQNIKLSSMLNVAHKQVTELEAKCKKQTKVIETRSKKLHDSQQECQRTKIHRDQLKADQKKSLGRIKLLKEDIKDLKEERFQLKRELKEMRKTLTQERLARQEAEIELDEKGKWYERERIVREDNIRLDYQGQINKLYEEITDLKIELEKEKTAHNIDKRGLDHLRNHFASLSVQNVREASAGHDYLTNLDTNPFYL
ncbi:coiled-coil domain-containing protein 160 homolog [Ptychodera flava]|uniref:coiled-coil domain-containing protein 160 homolog n=1 Tax=Ptychodera flava TaxID=63121 RepID=UPI00396A46C7